MLKVVMTGSAEDGPEWQKHIGNKKWRRDLANQFKDAKNPFKIAIVRDMWLTGLSPCHLMHLRDGGQLRFRKKGNAFLYAAEDVDRVRQEQGPRLSASKLRSNGTPVP